MYKHVFLHLLWHSSADEDVMQLELSHISHGNARWYSHYGKLFVVFYKVKHTPTIWADATLHPLPPSCGLPLCISVCVLLFSLSYKDNYHWVMDHLNPGWSLLKIHTLTTSAKETSPNKVTFSGAEWTYIFRATIQPNL